MLVGGMSVSGGLVSGTLVSKVSISVWGLICHDVILLSERRSHFFGWASLSQFRVGQSGTL